MLYDPDFMADIQLTCITHMYVPYYRAQIVFDLDFVVFSVVWILVYKSDSNRLWWIYYRSPLFIFLFSNLEKKYLPKIKIKGLAIHNKVNTKSKTLYLLKLKKKSKFIAINFRLYNYNVYGVSHGLINPHPNVMYTK